MKQKYLKPTLIVESFSLTQSIVHNCNVDRSTVNFNYGYECEYNEGDPNDAVASLANVFYTSINNECHFDVDSSLGQCYNNPDGAATQIFAS